MPEDTIKLYGAHWCPDCRRSRAFLGEHRISYQYFDVDEDAGTATAQCDITVFQGLEDFPLQPIFIGHYHDEFERAGPAWRFKRRLISPDLIGDLSRHRADMA